MKNIHKSLLSALALLITTVVFAAKPIAGPKGGRVLTTEAPYIEFFVEANRSVTVTFYDKDLKLLAPVEQMVSAIAETKTGKVRLQFDKTAIGFVSAQPLPEGDDFTVVVQVRDTASAKPRNHRVLFHDEICAECKRAEYACVCDDAGGEEGKKH